MSKRKTTDQFIQDATLVHGNLYDYSKTKYTGINNPIIVICSEHGETTQMPRSHLTTSGCKLCGHARVGKILRGNTDEFIAKSRTVHGEKYSYTNTEYKTNSDIVNIGCKYHGNFEQTPSSHLGGSGCPTCADERSKTKQMKSTELFISEAIVAHGEKYSYDKVDYSGSHNHVTITCPTHGNFEQRPTNHLSGQGCPNCGWDKISVHQRDELSDFTNKADVLYGSIYDYTSVDYVCSNQHVTIGCSIHGDFLKTPNKHLLGQGCPWCSWEQLSLNNTKTTNEFISDASDIHRNKYTYPNILYVNNKTMIEIQCPDHGPFYQRPSVHLRGSGCSRCVGSISVAEQEIFEYLNGLSPNWVQGDYSILKTHELDMVNHELKIAVEYCGLYWHSVGKGKDKNYHLNKLIGANKQGYKLITIFEDEWVNKRNIILSRLAHAVGSTQIGAGGRKLSVREIKSSEAKEFLSQYHIQGSGPAGRIRVGAFYKHQLVGVMTMGSSRGALGAKKSNTMELLRFCGDEYSHVGMASKLFTYITNTHELTKVITYADRRWSDGSVYTHMGFVPTGDTPPNFWYFKNGYKQRYHRYTFRKDILISKYDADPNLTGTENMTNMGYDRIYDCGSKKFEWFVNQT